MISGYTKEAGLRNLEREIAAICRKMAVKVARGEVERMVIDPAQVEKFLGARKHFAEELLNRDRVGVATGLAWTSVGGDLLFIEVVAVPGKGLLLLTGQLGDVMKESAQAAVSFARAYAATHGIGDDFFGKHDLHVHVPAGSIPKDGPSAGITIGTAILSVLTGKPINRRLAMTGEITLRGDVLPIGGLKEKVLAAKLAGIQTGDRSQAQPARSRGHPGDDHRRAHLPFRRSHGRSAQARAARRRSAAARRHPDRRAGGDRRRAAAARHGVKPPVPAAAGEDPLIDWLRRRLRRQPGGELVGDDAALLPPGSAADSFAVTVDHQIAGVHFPPALDPAVVARRLLAVNLSDLAAMGASPAYAFLALAAPQGFDHRRFFTALLAACRRHGLTLAGGDLARGQALSTSLTLLGRKAAGARWLERSGARPGHALWLGGTIGESALGRLLIERGEPDEAFSSSLRAAARRAVRRHLALSPQLALGRWLGERTAEGAAMDVSDGLARDLHRLCRASGVGAEIEAGALPFADRFAHLCAAAGADPLALALGGGEDYVLLFTLPEGVAPPPEMRARRIGKITKRRRVTLVNGKERSDLPAIGWDHLL